MGRERSSRRVARRAGSPAREEARARDPGADRRATLVAVGLLCLVSALVFANTFQNDFAYDDAYVVRNRLIKDLGRLPSLFVTGYAAGIREERDGPQSGGGSYRPLVMVTFALNYTVGGLRPFGYHLVNLLLHTGVCVLLYALGLRLGLSRGGALAAALLFAIHPLHTEAVTGIVGRAEPLLALGVLAALWWYPAGAARARSLPFLLASYGAFIAALLSKEQAVMLPALLVLYELAAWERQGSWRAWLTGVLRRVSGYLILLGAYVAVRALVLGIFARYKDIGQISLLDNPLAGFEWDVRLLTALKVAGTYLWLFVWPARLSADYSYNAIPAATSLLEPTVLAALLAWGGLLALAIYAHRRRARVVLFGIGLMGLAFFPASNFLVVIGTIMGERLFYLPSAGLCLVIGAGWDRFQARTGGPGIVPWLRWAGVGAFVVILALAGGRTILRNRDWRDTETLMRSAVDVVPESARVHFILGYTLKDPSESLRELDEAVRIRPVYPDRRVRDRHVELIAVRAAMLLNLGRPEEAVEVLTRAVLIDPTDGNAHYNLGLAYAQQERWPEAEAAYRRAVALGPQYPVARNGLSVALQNQGRYADALAEADEAIRLNPAFPEAHYSRAQALEALGRYQEAVAAYERLLVLQPDLSQARMRLESIHRRLGGQGAANPA